MKETYTILIGGQAGEGVKKAAQVLAEIFLIRGRHTFQMDDYQSLIKGGHNFSVLTLSLVEVFATYQKADLIICFDDRSVKEHIQDLAEGGLLFYNSDETSLSDGIGLPLSSLKKKLMGVGSNISSSCLAILYALLQEDTDYLGKQIRKYYKRDAESNIAFATAVFDLIQDLHIDIPTLDEPSSLHHLSGNQLIALGAWTVGLDVYYAYPMTPASSLMHSLAAKQKELKVLSIHAESELAAINMAIGSAFAGARSAVGSSGGGFALMQEAFSMAGMVEAPLLCILSSRPGPATGVSTYTAQEDLNFALHQGHGEFCRVVASPDSFERAYSLAAELLSLAWEVQIPTILLTEKHLSESMKSSCVNPDNLPFAEYLAADENPDYQRYALSESGISPLAFPPSEQVIKWNSHEHLASGLRTDRADKMIEMKDKRDRKNQYLKNAVKKYNLFNVYGEGERLVFAYGSTALEIREAMKHLDLEIKLIVPIYLEPFPVEELKAYESSTAVVIEHNSSGSFAQFLQNKLKLKIKANILKYDGRAFDPKDLAKRIEEAWHA